MTAILPGLVFLIGAAAPRPQVAPPQVNAPRESVQYDLCRYRDRVEADGSSERTLEVRVLLQTATAVAEFGQIKWPYIDGYGDVQFEKVTIERPDGRTVEVENGLIEDLNPYGVTATSVAADVHFKRLTIPGLDLGDWLSYKIIHRQKPLAPGRIFGEMKLAAIAGDPVQSYELDLPRDAGIQVRLRDGLGASWEDAPAASDRLVRRLHLKVEQPRADQRVPTKAVIQAEAEPDVIFTTFRSWDEVARWWWALSRDHLNPDPYVKTEAARLVASKATARERIAALHGFVTSRIRYLNVSFGIGRMQPRPATDVLANRYGDCKDKHALLAALASAVGIDVRPVLIDSVRSDLRDDVPAPQQFDHMISVARLGPEPAEWLWLDATNPFGPPEYLGPELRGKRALLIEESGEGRIVRTPAEPPFVPWTETQITGTLDPDRAFRGRVVRRFRSDQEVQLRTIFAVIPQDLLAEVVRSSLAREWEDGKVTNVVVSDAFDTTEPFRVEFDVERPGGAQSARWTQMLLIPLPKLSVLPPASASIEVAARELVVRAEIEMPEGMGVRAPRSISLDRPFGKFESTYSVEGRRLKVARTLKLVRRSVSEDELTSYEAFRYAIFTDDDKSFFVLGPVGASDPGRPLALRKTETRRILLPENAPGENVKHHFEVDEGVMDAELTDIPEGVSLCLCIGNQEGCYPFCRHGTAVMGSINVSRADPHYKPGHYDVTIYYYPPKAPRTRDVDVTLTVNYAPLAAPQASSASGSGSPTVSPEEAAKKVRDALESLGRTKFYSSEDPGIRSVVAMGRVAVPELLAILREVRSGGYRQLSYRYGAAEALAALAADEDLPALASLLANGCVEAARGLEHLSGAAVREALLVPLRKGFSGPELTAALTRFQKDPEVQDAVVAYLDKFGPAADVAAGDVAEFAGRAGIRAAVPVLNRLVAAAPAVTPARRMFASALVSLHDPAGIRALVQVFLTTIGDGMFEQWERHAAGETLNHVVGERFYIGSTGPGGAHGNFEEATERFRAWWSDAQAKIHWEDKLGKWAW